MLKVILNYIESLKPFWATRDCVSGHACPKRSKYVALLVVGRLPSAYEVLGLTPRTTESQAQ